MQLFIVANLNLIGINIIVDIKHLTFILLYVFWGVFVSADPPNSNYKLEWSDEFNSNKLDLNKWKYQDIGKRKDAINTSDAISVENGNLVIKTYTENNIHYTGMVSTKGIFESKYGYWEAKIKFSDSPGTFSDFWLWSDSVVTTLYDPKGAGVEIDIVEHREIDNEWNYISGINSINLHWGDYGEHHNWDGTETEDLNIGDGYHLFGLEWTPSYYKFFVDNKLVWTHTVAISDRNEFMILSTEIDNMRWSGPIPKYGYGTKENTRTKMLVDFVRVFKEFK